MSRIAMVALCACFAGCGPARRPPPRELGETVLCACPSRPLPPALRDPAPRAGEHAECGCEIWSRRPVHRLEIVYLPAAPPPLDRLTVHVDRVEALDLRAQYTRAIRRDGREGVMISNEPIPGARRSEAGSTPGVALGLVSDGPHEAVVSLWPPGARHPRRLRHRFQLTGDARITLRLSAGRPIRWTLEPDARRAMVGG